MGANSPPYLLRIPSRAVQNDGVGIQYAPGRIRIGWYRRRRPCDIRIDLSAGQHQAGRVEPLRSDTDRGENDGRHLRGPLQHEPGKCSASRSKYRIICRQCSIGYHTYCLPCCHEYNHSYR